MKNSHNTPTHPEVAQATQSRISTPVAHVSHVLMNHQVFLLTHFLKNFREKFSGHQSPINNFSLQPSNNTV